MDTSPLAFPPISCFDSALYGLVLSFSALSSGLLTMATLRWPPYRIDHRMKYTHFLKTVFKYNDQRKDLMDKRDIDNTWKGMVYSKDIKSYQRESLMKQVERSQPVYLL